ncbi:hypothetical protein N7478_009802 [Penicillium angulare]|uniref:uncharacterized protein n=1 Tax=Penicillium angulare TaxID=116970 RepID=UPI002540A067|nr:uncharacterized protein N7478_009802 [Penicillium angulare]KAJ5266994.1 hypothetical protein N7478_009802 [Penicillium angulare]
MKTFQAFSYALLATAASAYNLHFLLGTQCNGENLDNLIGNDAIKATLNSEGCSTFGVTSNAQSIEIEEESGDDGKGFSFWLDDGCAEPYEQLTEGCINIVGDLSVGSWSLGKAN